MIHQHMHPHPHETDIDQRLLRQNMMNRMRARKTPMTQKILTMKMRMTMMMVVARASQLMGPDPVLHSMVILKLSIATRFVKTVPRNRTLISN